MTSEITYIPRLIDSQLQLWKDQPRHKPLLLRGARQVGKSSSIRHLGQKFNNFIEVNFEKRPELKEVFSRNHDVKQIAAEIGRIFNTRVKPGETLLFFDEIQECDDALRSLWFFKEDYPELHVIAAGSLLEFALKRITSYGVGRIRSLFMYPLSFEEFLAALNKRGWIDTIREASPEKPLEELLHKELINHFRSYIIIGGMPASVRAWVETRDYQESAGELKDIQQSYYDDFVKYSDKVNPQLLRSTLDSVIAQTGKKFTFSHVQGGYRPEEVKQALTMLADAGLITPIKRTAANGMPLGAETNGKFVKYQFLDSGLLLRILDLNFGGIDKVTTEILTSSASELVNRGGLAEMIAGWELIKSADPGTRHDLYYWENMSRGSTSEVDFVIARAMKVLPIEVKSGTSGKMKSLRFFMENKGLQDGIRTSLENFGSLSYMTSEEAEITISIIPIYAIGRLTHNGHSGCLYG
ncbi:MAG: AAA family ATPase [Duncaniella sp.]|nr:AAA family ATPase [Duncaniella sp.]